MGVIMMPVWRPDLTPAGIQLDMIPNASAYGLAVLLDDAADLTAFNWADFYDGTLIIVEPGGATALYVVHDGQAKPISISGAVSSMGSPGRGEPPGPQGDPGPAGPPATVVWQ